MMAESREQAIDRMIGEAEELGSQCHYKCSFHNFEDHAECL